MFATRLNQENVTHLHQTNAAGKPLNQALAKTPCPKSNAPKTPFRGRNDENAAQTILKTGAGKAKANLFVTPAPGKTRAVLGAKTTNAKALQTPGLGAKSAQKLAAPPSTQKISPRLKRSKVRVHQPDPSATVDEADDSAPEVEYCPPPRILTPPLPNYPDDIHELPLDDIFSQERLLRSIFAPTPEERDADGLTAHERAIEQQREIVSRQAEASLQLENLTFSEPDLEALRQETVAREQQKQRTASKPSRQAPGTLSSRHAASALSRPSPRPVPSFAAPTAAAAAKHRTAVAPKSTANAHHAVAAAASRTTVGYARGRQVSATKRAPLSNAHRAGVVRALRETARHPGVRDVLMPAALDDGESDGEVDEVRDEFFERLVNEDFVLEF
ncbi:hypothetical protein ANO11243_068240 [Dothideomycetidae sp. 11243]|nr:hypothetical protein ANO11243_068240 [fungal sp. No.11243]